MIFQEIQPRVELSSIIRLIRIRHFQIPRHVQAPSKPYPVRAEQCITFYPRGKERTEIVNEQKSIVRPRSVLTGQLTSRINRNCTDNDFLMIMVVLQPGVLYRLTGISAAEATNQHIDLSLIWRQETIDLEDLLACSLDYAQMIAHVEDFFVARMKNMQNIARPIEAVFSLMQQAGQNNSLSEWAGQACLSIRQFERLCYLYLGVSPKYYSRVVRFYRALDLKQANKQFDWLRIAMDLGYHDYQHLAKDFQDFASASPQTFMQQASRPLEKILGLST